MMLDDIVNKDRISACFQEWLSKVMLNGIGALIFA